MSDYDETREIGAKAFAEVFQDAYQQGKRYGIREGMLRAAEICERLIAGDGVVASDGVWVHDCTEAIRAEAEKERK